MIKLSDGKFKKDKTVKRYNESPEGKLLTNKIEKSKPKAVTKIQYKKPKKKKQSKKVKTKRRYVETGKYKLAKEYRDVARELNKAYDEVKQSGLTNNTIKLYERTLEQFYEKHGRKVKNMHHISTQMQSLDPEVIQELADITMTFADMALENRDFYLSDIISKIDPRDLQAIYDRQQDAILGEDTEYSLLDELDVPWNEFDIDKFNQIKEDYGVETIQDFVNWTDEMERYRSSAFLSEVLTSDQIAELWAYAQSGEVKINRRSFHMMIRANYNASGKTGNDLYTVVRNKIDKKKGV